MFNRFAKIIISKIAKIILEPKEFWVLQKTKNTTQTALLAGYFLPLLLIYAIAVFFGEFFRSSENYSGFAFLKSIREVVLFVGFYFISVYLTNSLIKTLGGRKNIQAVQKLVVYSMTPLLLVSTLTGLFRFLYILGVLSFYCFYIFSIGVNELLELPEQKRSRFIILTSVVNFFTFIIISIILTRTISAYI
jgi:hypothetical protein